MANETKQKRVKPELPGGFRDYGPADALARRDILRVGERVFEEYGFDPMETSAIEKTEVLLGGEQESDKIIWRVYSSFGAGRTALDTKREKKRDETSLRFDLTVPLARFIAAHPEIPKPYRRYQIGHVWRGESPQAGRYREFMQADIDIVGSSSLGADAEIITVFSSLYARLGIKNFVSKINSRKVLEAMPLYASFPQNKLWGVLRVMDKHDKIGDQAMQKELVKLIGKKSAEKIVIFMARQKDNRETLARGRKLLQGNAAADMAFKELAEIGEMLGVMGVAEENWEIDFSVVRGLAYYTGMVFETTLRDAPGIGSIAAGGRYDRLIMPFTGEKLPMVGGSLGVDRLYAALEMLGTLPKKETSTNVLIMNLSPQLSREYLAMARVLRGAGVNTALYLGDDRAFQAQLAYAVKREIPFAVIFGDEEAKKGIVAIKNLMTRVQQEIPKGEIVQFFKKQLPAKKN